MKKFLFLVFITAVCYLNTIGQTTYSKVYNIINGNEYGSLIKMFGGTQFILGDGICDPLTPNLVPCGFFLMINETENQYKTVVFGDNRLSFASHNAFAMSNDTFYIFAADFRTIDNDFVVYKTNLAGDSLGVLIYHPEFQSIYPESIMVKDDYIFLYGSVKKNQNKTNIIVIKMDKKGNFIKSTQFAEVLSEKSNFPKPMIETADGYLAIMSQYNDSDNKYPSVIKFDTDLNLVWHLPLPKTNKIFQRSDFPYMTPTNDGGMVISYQMSLADSIRYHPEKWDQFTTWAQVILKIDQNANMLWQDTMFTTTFPGQYFSSPWRGVKHLSTLENGDVLCIGDWNCFECDPENMGWLARYSSDGQLKWEHIYNDLTWGQGGYGSYFLSVDEAENGDLVCTGDIEGSGGEWNNSHYTWVLRLDSLGCFTPGCDTDSFSEVFTVQSEEVRINLSSDLLVYPNPSDDFLHLVLPEDMDADQLLVLNSTGQVVMKMDGSYEKIEVSHLPAGLYVIIVTDTGKKLTARTRFIKTDR